MKSLRRFLPKPETLRSNRWLRWLGPALWHPRLWHFSRRGVALGVALGVFFGLLIPLAQIPLAAGAAVLFRANVPAAIASTLVTNPFTFAPVYYVAWKLGSKILGEKGGKPPSVITTPQPQTTETSRWQSVIGNVTGVGRPLMLGLGLMAISIGLLTYFLISLSWGVKVRWQRARRRKLSAQRPR